MDFSRQEYWGGLPFPSPEDLPNPGTEPGSPTLQADSLLSEPPGKPLKICERIGKQWRAYIWEVLWEQYGGVSVNLEPDKRGFKSQLSQFVLVVWPATSNLTTLILSLLTFQTGMPLHTCVSLKVCSGYFPCPLPPCPNPFSAFLCDPGVSSLWLYHPGICCQLSWPGGGIDGDRKEAGISLLSPASM